MNADLPCGGGGGFRKGERAEGVERRRQKVSEWVKKFQMSREALELGGAGADGPGHLVAVGLEGRGRRV